MALALEAGQPPGNAFAHMDHEPVVAVAQAAQAAALDSLNLLAIGQATAQGELYEVAEKLAEALRDIIAFMPERDFEDNLLHGAIERWIP